MRAIQYLKSVPRYLTARLLGPRFPAIYTSGMGVLRYGEIEPPPLPGPGWARVRPILSGICGSDLASLTAKGSPYFSPITSAPFVFGHEVVGEVIEVDSGVDRVSPGDRVVLQPTLSCRIRQAEPYCEGCPSLEGRHVYRCDAPARGILSAGIQTGFCQDTGGAWSEGFVAHDCQLHKLPADLSDEAAVLAEPLSCALHAVLKAPLDDSKVVLVIGCGSIGALTIASIRAIGCRCRVIALAKHPHQRELARNLGADLVLNPSGGGFYSEMEKILDARSFQPELGGPVFMGGADVCFDCVASQRTLDDSVRFTNGGGSLMLVGMPAVAELDWTGIWFKELKVEGCYTCSDDEFARSLGLIHENEAKLRPLLTHKFALQDFRQALQCALRTGRSESIKTAFHP